MIGAIPRLPKLKCMHYKDSINHPPLTNPKWIKSIIGKGWPLNLSNLTSLQNERFLCFLECNAILLFWLLAHNCEPVGIQHQGSSRKAWLLITIFAIFSSSLDLILGGKRKGETKNQSRGQKSCLSARSLSSIRPFKTGV